MYWSCVSFGQHAQPHLFYPGLYRVERSKPFGPKMVFLTDFFTRFMESKAHGMRSISITRSWLLTTYPHLPIGDKVNCPVGDSLSSKNNPHTPSQAFHNCSGNLRTLWRAPTHFDARASDNRTISHSGDSRANFPHSHQLVLGRQPRMSPFSQHVRLLIM